ncbi:MAG: hypothetical protein WC996_06390 [Peptostreptococcales bacterium]
MNNNYKIYEKLWFWLIIALIGIPLIYLIVHFMYPMKYIPKNTSISAGDLLGFIGGFLAFIGTVYLGIVALKQNKNILSIEERKMIPSLKLLSNGETMGFSDKEINIQLFLNNENRFPIKIVNISNMKLEFLTHDEIPVSKWIEGYTILSNSELMIDFMNTNPSTKMKEVLGNNDEVLLYFKASFCVTLRLAHKDSKEYTQKFLFNFGLIIAKKLHINNIEYDYIYELKEDPHE